MEAAKRKIVYFWLTHDFLRRMGKRYPEWFKEWVTNSTDSSTATKIMRLRYTGERPLKCEAIALELGITPRRVFQLHQNTVNAMISL